MKVISSKKLHLFHLLTRKYQSHRGSSPKTSSNNSNKLMKCKRIVCRKCFMIVFLSMSTKFVSIIQSQTEQRSCDKCFKPCTSFYCSFHNFWVNFNRVCRCRCKSYQILKYSYCKIVSNSFNVSSEQGILNFWTKPSNPFFYTSYISVMLHNKQFHSPFSIFNRSFLLASNLSLRFYILIIWTLRISRMGLPKPKCSELQV